MKMPSNKLLAALIVFTFIFYILMITFNALGGAGYKGLFNASVGSISNEYTVYLTPSGWTFSIWSVIYIYLGIGAAYSLSTVFRARPGSELAIYEQNPVTLNWFFYSALLANYVLNTAWIFIWLGDLIVAATIILCFIAYTGWLAFAIACFRGERSVMKAADPEAKIVMISELWYQRVIIHNGIALYTTWTTIASLLSLNISIQYFSSANAEITSLVCLSVLLFLMLAWFVVENIWWDRYVRYTLTQYPVVMFASGGILDKQLRYWDRPDGLVPSSVHILTWIILGVASTLFVIRLLLVFYRYFSKPLFTSSSSSPARRQK